MSDTISGMTAKRPKLAIDAGPAITLGLNRVAGDQSVKRQERVTVRALVLEAVRDKWGREYPELARAIEEEL